MNDNTARDHSKVSAEKLRKIMAQVANMLAKADDPSCTVAEAEQNRNRAEVLMARYRLEESQLSAVDQALLGIAVKRAVWRMCPMSSEFERNYSALASYVVNHIEAEAVLKYVNDDNGGTWLAVEVFAYESDLMYGEQLFNSMRLAFASKLEPKRDPSMSDAANVYAMRNAGMERRRIAEVMGYPATSGPGKVSKEFKAECARRDEDASDLLGKGNSMAAFRADYATSFVNVIWQRLATMRAAAGADSAGLVMADRHDKVREAIWTAYPKMRPSTAAATPYKAPNGDCDRCKAAASGYCRSHAWLKPSRARVSTRRGSAAGQERGRAAARSVDLGQSRGLKG